MGLDDQDKLGKVKQTIEFTEPVALLNGAWIPTKQIKTLHLSDGDLVMTYNFENIQVNTGLADWLFDPEGQ